MLAMKFIVYGSKLLWIGDIPTSVNPWLVILPSEDENASLIDIDGIQ